MKALSFILLSFVLSFTIFAQQAELQKVAPLPPEAATIVKYGEIPVGFFTGVANIGIPIFSIQSRDISLPINLSYHSGGNKVEDIASWVGLGWSISSIPSVSRTIRGKPDESIVGIINPYSAGGRTYSTSDIAQILLYGEHPEYANLICQFLEGNLDTEPDIYYFNLVGKSGRFFWDQNKSKYQTDPYSNIKIVQNGNNFEITDEDGTIYKFSDVETSQSSGNIQGPSQKVSWKITKILNPNKNDSLSFYYNLETQITKSINPRIKSVRGTCIDNSSIISTTIFQAKVLSVIEFANGSANFIRQPNERDDLIGSYALEKIQLRNRQQKLIKEFKLNYSYLESSVNDPQCNIISSSMQEKKRLLLRKVIELNGGDSLFAHILFYDTTTNSPCRISSAQDFWGYFNGETDNQDLVADAPFSVDNVRQLIPGANRFVNPEYSQFGILKKIVYPTGGYSEFEYENNEAYNNNLPAHYINRQAILEGGGGAPTQSIYIDTFLIRNPSDYYTNQKTNGVYANITFGDLGCDLSSGGQICAQLYLRGLESNNSEINTTITYNLNGYHLPNGLYEMKAVFNQTPTAYENFFYNISWKEVDTTRINRFSGGLRIKKITSGSSDDLLINKYYSYNIGFEKDTSSGDVFGTTQFIKSRDFICHKNGEGFSYEFGFMAESNATTVSHSGSYIGYRNVYESLDSLSTNGYTEYLFSHQKDLYSDLPPYIPSVNLSEFRGQPSRISVFKKVNNDFFPVSRTENDYLYQIFEQDSVASLKVLPMTDNPHCGPEPGCSHIVSLADRYYIYPTASKILKSTERQFDQNDSTKSSIVTTNFVYSPLTFQLSNKIMTDSRSQTIESKYYYPNDLLLTGQDEIARQGLISQNRISSVLKSETLRNNIKIGELRSNYRLFGNIIMPYEIFETIGNNNAESRIKFLSYASSGNLLSQQKTGNTLHSYIWDYNQNFPIAEIINAESFNTAYTSFEADGKGNWVFSGTPITDASAPTGSKAYVLESGHIIKSDLSANEYYLLSYWTKNSTAYSIDGTQPGYPLNKLSKNGWKYYEHRIYGKTSVTIYGIGLIDELRLHPENAYMTTTAYEPLVGVIGLCDANNKIVKYEYDELNRLSLIRDHEGLIVKKICYNYANQAVGCQPAVIYYNTAQSQTFTRNNCGSCNLGSQVPYTIAANTYSSTVSIEAANQLALNDIAANGQNYANSNGTCTALLPLTYNNQVIGSAGNGFTAVYTERTTGQVYSFTIPGYGSGSLGCIPAGSYNLTISKPNGAWLLYGSGCFYITGNSATFGKVNPAMCSQISLQLDAQ